MNFQLLFEKLGAGYAHCRFIADEQGSVTDFIYLDANLTFKHLLGLEEIIGKRAAEVSPFIGQVCPQLYEDIGLVSQSRKDETIEFEIRWLNKFLRMSIISYEKDEFVVFFEDITATQYNESSEFGNSVLFRKVFENSMDGVLFTSINGRIFLANSAASRILGWSHEEMIRGGRDLIFDHDDAKLDRARQEILFKGRFIGELNLKRKNDGIVPVLFSEIVVPFENGEYRNIVFFKDITEQKQIEESRLLVENRFNDVLRYSLDLPYRYNYQKGCYDYLSQGLLRIAGYKVEKLMRMSTEDIFRHVHPEDLSEVKKNIAKAEADFSNNQNHLEYRVKDKNGQYHWYDDYFFIKRDETGKPLARIGSIRDITKRKSAEYLLTETVRDQQIIFDNASIGISKIIDRKLVWLNRKTLELFRYPAKGLENQTTRKLYRSQLEYEQLWITAFPVLSQGQVYISEQMLNRRDNTSIHVKCTGKAIDPSDLSKGVIWLLEDISERKIAEEALRESEATYQKVFENKFIAICIVDPETFRFLDVNETQLRLYGYSREEFLGGLTVQDLSAEKEKTIETVLTARNKNEIYIPLRYHRKKDGTIFPVEIVGQTHLLKDRYVMFGGVKDITRQQQAEEAYKKNCEELEQRVFERTADLAKINSTLITMLDYARKAEIDIQDRVVANLRSSVLPLIGLLKRQDISQNTVEILETIENTTHNLARPLGRLLESSFFQLTAREIQIANFVRQGKSNKEIMQLLNISFQTVESHRNNLRKKLGLRHKKINLRTYLNSQFEG